MRRIAALLAAAVFVLLLAPSGASAHEGKLVAGKYNFVVGWGDEPAYNGFKNSIQLILGDAGHKPVTDLSDTLQVEVITGDQKTTLPLQANFEVGEFGEPGDYRAWLVPTRAGDYTFHFFGTIHGDKIDERFTSSDKTFDPVKDVSEAQFPVKDPTAGQLADRITREGDRAGATAKAAASTAKDAHDKAGSATTLAVVAIVVGALGLVVGGMGLARRR